MNDTERYLRERFAAAERELLTDGPRTVLPVSVRRRIRRRQAGNLVLASVTALGVAAAAVLIAIGLMPFERDGEPLGTEQGATRTVSVPYGTITYPTSWTLMVWNEAIESKATIQLTNFDPDVRAHSVCFSENKAMPSNGVVLHIATEPHGDVAGLPPEPGTLRTAPLRGRTVCGGERLAASWLTAGIPMSATVVIGPDASDADRTALFDAFDGLATHIDTLGHDAPHGEVVLSAGTVADTPWLFTVTVDRSQTGVMPQLNLGASPSGEVGGLRGSGIGGVAIERPEDTWINAPLMGGNTMLFGAVSNVVARVEVRPDGQAPFDAELVDAPTSLGTSARFFVAPMTGASRGVVITHDVGGNIVAAVSFTPDGYTSPETQAGKSAAEGTIATGTAVGTNWELVDVGRAIYLQAPLGEAGDPSVLMTSPRAPDPALSFGSYTFESDAGKTASIVFGATSVDVREVVLFTSGLPGAMQLVTLTDGTQVYYQVFEPGEMKGQVIALGANCDVLQRIDLSNGQPASSPAPTACDA
jgi:hypothetical protein